jgi:hypothetical protein
MNFINGYVEIIMPGEKMQANSSALVIIVPHYFLM